MTLDLSYTCFCIWTVSITRQGVADENGVEIMICKFGLDLSAALIIEYWMPSKCHPPPPPSRRICQTPMWRGRGGELWREEWTLPWRWRCVQWNLWILLHIVYLQHWFLYPTTLDEGCNTSSFGKPYKLWLFEKQFSSLKSASNIKMLLFCWQELSPQ